MGIISRIQLLTISIFIAIVLILSFVLLIPLANNIANSTRTIYSVYRKKDEKIMLELKHKNKSLLRSKESIKKLTSAENSSAKWYDFLQKTLKNNNIDASKINGTGIINNGKFDIEDFTLCCNSSYHNIGKFINDAENSDFVCSIKEVHLISQSLLSSNLNADITISFYRKRL